MTQGYSRSVYPGNRINETESPSADTSEEVTLGSMKGKNSDVDVDVDVTQIVEEDSSNDRSTEIGPDLQLETTCDKELMKFNVNVEEAVPGPSSTQELLTVSTAAGLVLKKQKNEAFIIPGREGSVKCDTLDLSRSGVPRGKEDGSVVSSNSVSISCILKTEETNPTVVSSPRKRSWKRMARNNAARISTEPVQPGKRSINFE
ncbi:hypothetical protein ACOSP7_027984 [Xanthoceras sorbifolium]